MEIEVTPRDIFRATWARAGAFGWYFAFFWTLSVVRAARGESPAMFAILTLAMLFVLGSVFAKFARLDDAHRRVEVRVQPDGVHHRTGGSSSTIAFEDIRRVRWTKHVVFLYLATGAVSTVMTRSLDTESAERLRHATSDRIKKPAAWWRVVLVVVLFLVGFTCLWTNVMRDIDSRRDDARLPIRD